VCLTCWGRRAAHSHFETAASRSRHRSIPRRDPPDEHGQWRPLLDRLSAPAIAPNVPAEWGRVIFLLASKRQTPEYTGQQLPELNGYRAITAITPRGRSASSGMTQRIKPSRSATRTSQVSTFSRLANSSGSIMQSESRRTTRRSKFPTVPILILRLLRDTFVPLRMRNGVPQASGSSNAATSSRPVTGSLQLTPCWTQPRRGSNPLWTGASGTIRYSEGGSRCGVHQHLSRES